MNGRKEFCEEIRKLIKEKSQEIVFFTGAGISSNPPSSLPLAKDVKSALLESLCKRGEKTHIDQFYEDNRKKIEEFLYNVTMESVFEIITLRQRLNEQFVTRIITEVFNEKNPNKNHILLARFLKEGCNIITTNFDVLIEETIKKEFGHSHSTKIDHLLNRIMHVHGSIDDPQSIITILSQVGQGFTEKIEHDLKNALKNKIVIFVGWSNKDIDITPILFLSEMSQIYWLQHHKEPEDGIILRHNDDKIKNSNDPINQLIKKFKGTKYIGKTDSVVDEIWHGFDRTSKQPEYSEKTNSRWKEPIKRLEDLEESDRALIFLEVLDRIDSKKKLPLELIGELEKTFGKTFSSNKFSEFSEIERSAFYELCCKKSVSYRIISNYEEAIKSAEQGLRMISTPEEDFSWFIELKNDIASAHNDWGRSCRKKGNCEKAIKEHGEAVKIFEENIKKLGDKLGKLRNLTKEDKLSILLDKAQVHTNLGSTYLPFYDTCLECSKSPDFRNKLLNGAEENYLEGIKIHKNLRDKLSDALRNYNERKLGDLYNNIANLYSRKSEKEKAKNYYEKCLNVQKKCGNVRGTKRILGDYLSFIEKLSLIEKNNLYCVNILEQMRIEREALEFAFVEKPTSFFQLHLLYNKRKL